MAARRWTLFIALFFISAAVTSSGWRTTEEDGDLRVWDVISEKETDPAHLNYSNVAEVFLMNPKINTFTTEMQSQIQNVSSLWLKSGVVPTVHVAPQFKGFVVVKCDTSNVIINSNLIYATKFLTIQYNKLKKLPKHLNAMKNLWELDFTSNQIEYVDMADFNGLNNLERISLSENEIIEISDNPVVLPGLFGFDASGNRLSYINFEHWKATNLNTIWLSRNELSIALAISSIFPSLTEVDLHGNPFNCQWFNATMKELRVRNVEIMSETQTACNEGKDFLKEFRTIMLPKRLETLGVKLEKFLTHFNAVQDERDKSIREFQKTTMAEVDRLKHMIADLTEALYVHELEELHDTNG